jgi:single-stranded-DNA-specific exonuclease
LPYARVGDLRERLIRFAAAQQDGEPAIEELECDAELRLSDLTPDFLATLEQLGPFGNGNPEPVFVSKAVRLTTALKVIKERHLRLSVEDGADGKRFGGMAWSRRTDWAALARNEGWAQGDWIDLAYRLRRNWHPDFAGWELEVVAIRSAQPPAA